MATGARWGVVVGLIAAVFAAAGALPAAAPRMGVGLAPDDPFYGFAGSRWPYTLTHIDAAWSIATGSPAVVIAVIDSGMDASQPDLAGSVLPGYNELAANPNTRDDNGHGTAVAATAAAHTGNWIGGVGVCDGCRILPVKVVNENGLGIDEDIAAGIKWAVGHGARIVNLSLGGGQASARITSMIGSGGSAGGRNDNPLAAAVADAQRHNVLVVAAAGNDGATTPEYPAAYPGVLSVAAVQADGTLVAYSNHGPDVMVAAPYYANAPQGDTYRPWFGTSFASAYVAGLAGLALSAYPNLSAAQLRTLIERTATPGIDVAYGTINAQALIQALASAGSP